MKKSILWRVILGAGAVLCTAAAILAVLYGKDAYSFASKRVANLKLLK